MALMSRELGTPPPPPSVRRRQRRQLLVAAVVVGVGLAAFGGTRFLGVRQAKPLDPNRAIATQVLRLGEALDTHATRIERPRGEPALPTNQAFLPFLLSLPEAARPAANPWGGARQGSLVAAGGQTGLPTAAEHLAGTPLPLVGTALGPGEAPGPGPLTARTYGALIYDHDPRSDSYVLYGIGQAGDRAVVAAAVARKP